MIFYCLWSFGLCIVIYIFDTTFNLLLWIIARLQYGEVTYICKSLLESLTILVVKFRCSQIAWSNVHIIWEMRNRYKLSLFVAIIQHILIFTSCCQINKEPRFNTKTFPNRDGLFCLDLDSDKLCLNVMHAIGCLKESHLGLEGSAWKYWFLASIHLWCTGQP